jgi:hypothetical protein
MKAAALILAGTALAFGTGTALAQQPPAQQPTTQPAPDAQAASADPAASADQATETNAVSAEPKKSDKKKAAAETADENLPTVAAPGAHSKPTKKKPPQ